MREKFHFFIISILLMFTALSIGVCAEGYDTGTYLVKAYDGARLYETAEKSFSYKSVAPEGAYLTVIETSGDFGYTVYDCIYGWVELSSLEYVNSRPHVTDSEKIEGAKSLQITALPEKVVYTEGEESADISGLEVALVFNDEQGSKMPVSGYTVAFPDLDTYGRKTVTVYYGGFSTVFPITVVKVPLTGIVITKPDKTTYIEGEAISFEGLTVTAYYSDGRDSGKGIVLDENEYSIEGVTQGDTSLAPGAYKVTVTHKYPEISASFHIYVSEKNVTSLKLLDIPETLTLYQGQTFNTDEFELQATYDNGSSEIITTFDIEYDNMKLGTYTARIYYMDRYVAFDYTILELLETGIELGDTSFVGSYVGDGLNFSRLSVYILYNSGEKRITDAYTLEHNIDTSVIGMYPVTVTYGEYSAQFDYNVSKRSEIRIGDVNFDSVVNASDARLALRNAARLEELSADAVIAADVDFDEKVTAADARKILRVAAGLDKF